MDKIHQYKHKSGLEVIFVPRPGYNERYAMFTTKYGSVDSYLRNVTTGGTMDVPHGIAHFLEHKLFEQEKINVMEQYAMMGARPNAFTSNVQTSYLFSCAGNFRKSLELLLEYVQNPYFTEKSVEKEKGIIGQEINMYLDNPDSAVYMNLMRALYVNNPVRNDIAGSIESISKITPDLLYLLYNTFYIPSNMVLVITGDEDISEIEKIVDSSLTDKWSGRPSTGYEAYDMDEPMGICEKSIKRKMDVSMPIFMYGYKDNNISGEPIDKMKKELELKIIQEVLFGKSSEFYDRLYNQGIINETFYNYYDMERSFAFSVFGGEAKEPDRIIENIQKCISDAKKGNISEKDFNRIKNGNYGSFIKRLNSIEATCRVYTNAHMAGISVVDYFDLYDKIDYNSAMEQLKIYDESKSAVSVIV